MLADEAKTPKNLVFFGVFVFFIFNFNFQGGIDNENSIRLFRLLGI